MTTPATTARARWIAWPGWDADAFNGFVASEVAAATKVACEDAEANAARAEKAESRAALAEKRVGEAEGLLKRALGWIPDGMILPESPECMRLIVDIKDFLSPPPSPGAGYVPRVGDVVRETVSPFPEHRGEWLVWADISESLYLCRPGKSRHPSFQRSKGCAPMEFVRPATPAEATAAKIAVPDDGHDRADCPEWSKCSRHTTLQPAPAAEARPSHVRTTRAPSGTPLEAGVVAGVRRWSSDNEPIVEGGWVLLSGEWEPACPPTRAALLDALLGLSRNDHKDSALLVVDALDAYLRPWLAFVEAMAVVKADEARTERNTMDENVCIEAARALVAAKEVK